MKNLSKILIIIGILILGILFGSIIRATNSITNSVKEIPIFKDTLVLENHGKIDLYAVDDGRWVIISLDDLKYIIKKRRISKETIKNLESLFERFEVPEKVLVKPTFK